MDTQFERMTEQERKAFAGYIQGGHPCRLCKYESMFKCVKLGIKVDYEDTCKFFDDGYRNTRPS